MKTRENIKDKPGSRLLKNDLHNLVLHNDDINTFDFVIDSLIDICQHNIEQAEQCAYITHYKGKCDVKKGPFEILVPLKEKLVDKWNIDRFMHVEVSYLDENSSTHCSLTMGNAYLSEEGIAVIDTDNGKVKKTISLRSVTKPYIQT